MNIKNTLVVLAVVSVALLTGCSTSGASQPDPQASVAAPATDETLEVEVTPPPIDNSIVQFGGVYTWEDGVSLSVSAPADFVPTEYAMGATPGQPTVVFTFVLTNGTDKPLEPMIFPSAASGGVEAGIVIDSNNELGGIGYGPTTSILPGGTIQWYAAFSVADPANITVEASPGFEYENVIFTNVKP